MKKLLLLLVICIGLSSQKADAETFDERDLIGTWKMASVTGTYHAHRKEITSIDVIILGPFDEADAGVGSSPGFDGVIKGESFDDDVEDWCISNSNKLHIFADGGIHLRFVIKQLSKHEMSLESFDGSFKITFTKGESAVPQIQLDNNNREVKDFVDIAGRTNKRPTQGINIVRYNDGTTDKIIVK